MANFSRPSKFLNLKVWWTSSKEIFSKISSGLENKFWDRKRVLFLFLIFVIAVVGIFGFEKPAQADISDYVAKGLTWIVSGLISLVGGILLMLIGFLISVAQYNNFVVSTAVVNGWVIVRDLCNMFFIVVLLVIAIATILKLETYHYKKLLGRLIIMAVLINFSKTICGIIIDFAQVLTLTFVNGFKAAAGGNFVQLFKLDKIMKVSVGQEASPWDVLGAYVLGLIMLVIATVTILVMLAIFVIRIVMLWILIVLSPLAFFLSVVSLGKDKNYAAQWWSQFGNYVIVGPVLAFFLWLSLISVTTLSEADKPPPLEGAEGIEQRIAITEIGTTENMIGFIIAIGMLVGGLHITSQISVMGATMAGGAVSLIKRQGMGVAKWVAKKPVQLGSYAGAKFYERTGIELRPSKRAEMRKERKSVIEAQREARGMASAAERAAGGRTFLSAVLDPRLAKTMSRWEMAKVVVGRPEAEAKMQRSIEGLAGAARNKMYSVDPFQGYILEQRTGANMARARAERIEKRAEKARKKIEKNNQPLIIQSRAAEEKLIDLEKQRSSLEEAMKDFEVSKKRISEIDKERSSIGREISDLERERRRTPKQEEDLKTLKQRDAQLAEEKNRLAEKIKIVVEPQIVGIDSQIKEIESKLRELDKEYKTAPRERQREIEQEHEKLNKSRKSLVEERSRIEENPFAYRLADIAAKIKVIKEEKQKIDNDVQIAFKPVEVMLKQAEEWRKIAKEKEEILNLPYEEQLKAATKRATEVGISAIMKKIGEAVREQKINLDQAKELIGMVSEHFGPDEIEKKLEAMLKK